MRDHDLGNELENGKQSHYPYMFPDQLVKSPYDLTSFREAVGVFRPISTERDTLVMRLQYDCRHYHSCGLAGFDGRRQSAHQEGLTSSTRLL